MQGIGRCGTVDGHENAMGFIEKSLEVFKNIIET